VGQEPDSSRTLDARIALLVQDKFGFGVCIYYLIIIALVILGHLLFF